MSTEDVVVEEQQMEMKTNVKVGVDNVNIVRFLLSVSSIDVNIKADVETPLIIACSKADLATADIPCGHPDIDVNIWCENRDSSSGAFKTAYSVATDYIAHHITIRSIQTLLIHNEATYEGEEPTGPMAFTDRDISSLLSSLGILPGIKRIGSSLGNILRYQ
jgi:hypothetical protein